MNDAVLPKSVRKFTFRGTFKTSPTFGIRCWVMMVCVYVLSSGGAVARSCLEEASYGLMLLMLRGQPEL